MEALGSPVTAPLSMQSAQKAAAEAAIEQIFRILK